MTVPPKRAPPRAARPAPPRAARPAAPRADPDRTGEVLRRPRVGEWDPNPTKTDPRSADRPDRPLIGPDDAFNHRAVVVTTGMLREMVLSGFLHGFGLSGEGFHGETTRDAPAVQRSLHAAFNRWWASIRRR